MINDMKRTVFIATLAATLLVGGCAMEPKSEMTPLQIQSLQTRNYPQGKDIVFPSVISIFQDLGYTIDNADKETGLVTAQSPSQSSFETKFWLGMSSVSQTKATAFVERIGQETRVRLSFVEANRTSSAYGRSDEQETPILDASIYANAFERLENAVFVRETTRPKYEITPAISS